MLKIVFIGTHPYAEGPGWMEVPDDLSEEEEMNYITDNWEDVVYGAPPFSFFEM